MESKRSSSKIGMEVKEDRRKIKDVVRLSVEALTGRQRR